MSEQLPDSDTSTWDPALDAVVAAPANPDGTQLPPNRDVIKALQAWDGQGCLVVDMAPQPAGRVLNASGKPLHGIRVEMKAAK
jgi:hypothetical protein